jgi:hypothetical protein
MDNVPLLLGQRVVAILETGLRTATYKLATLMALIEHCIENLPEQPDDTLRVPLPALAHRVLEIYWQQVQLFDGNELRQSTGSRARILSATKELRVASGRATGSVDVARLRAPAAYDRAIDDVVLCLAQQPLHRLQKVPGSLNQLQHVGPKVKMRPLRNVRLGANDAPRPEKPEQACSDCFPVHAGECP